MRYLLLLVLLFVLVGCGTLPGRLLVTNLEYPDELDVSQHREFVFTFTVQNVGEQPCTVQNIFTPDFWKTENPGASGNANTVVDVVVPPGSEAVVVVPVYVWDSDMIKDHMKRFALTMNIVYNDECPQSFLTREGFIWIYK